MLLFENFIDIDSICKEYNIENYTINADGSIDVDGDVYLSNFYLDKLPLNFRYVNGMFSCSFNNLTSLVGSPKKVTDHFNCSYNQLVSLEYGPKEVGSINCQSNKLITLDGSPTKVGNAFECQHNKLVSLKGVTSIINGNFYCFDNKLESLKDGPEIINGHFDCSFNPIYNIVKLFKNYNEFKSLLDDYNYIRGNKIIKTRFIEACIDSCIEIPNNIEGYEMI